MTYEVDWALKNSYLLTCYTQIPGPGEQDIPALDGRELELMSEKPEDDVVLTLQDLMPGTK